MFLKENHFSCNGPVIYGKTLLLIHKDFLESKISPMSQLSKDEYFALIQLFAMPPKTEASQNKYRFDGTFIKEYTKVCPQFKWTSTIKKLQKRLIIDSHFDPAYTEYHYPFYISANSQVNKTDIYSILKDFSNVKRVSAINNIDFNKDFIIYMLIKDFILKDELVSNRSLREIYAKALATCNRTFPIKKTYAKINDIKWKEYKDNYTASPRFDNYKPVPDEKNKFTSYYEKYHDYENLFYEFPSIGLVTQGNKYVLVSRNLFKHLSRFIYKDIDKSGLVLLFYLLSIGNTGTFSPQSINAQTIKLMNRKTLFHACHWLFNDVEIIDRVGRGKYQFSPDIPNPLLKTETFSVIVEILYCNCEVNKYLKNLKKDIYNLINIELKRLIQNLSDPVSLETSIKISEHPLKSFPSRKKISSQVVFNADTDTSAPLVIVDIHCDGFLINALPNIYTGLYLYYTKSPWRDNLEKNIPLVFQKYNIAPQNVNVIFSMLNDDWSI